MMAKTMRAMGMKQGAAWLAAACCACAAAAREPETRSELVSAPFRVDIRSGVRVLRPGTEVEIRFSDCWGNGPEGGVTVTAEGAALTNNAAGEGRCRWMPEKTGVNILRHECGGGTLTARFFLQRAGGGPRPDVSDAGSDGLRLDIMDGMRPALLRKPIGNITFSDSWDGESGGTVTVRADGEDGALHTDTDPGDGVCPGGWTPTRPGVNILRHTDGDTELTARFLVMKDATGGRGYSFQMEEADPVLAPGGQELYKGPYTWAETNNVLESIGLSLSPEGVLSGRAACRSGRHAFTATITDSEDRVFTKTYPLYILPGGTMVILR